MPKTVAWLLALALAVTGLTVVTAPPAQAACSEDWIANSGDPNNNGHLNVVTITNTAQDIEQYLFKGSTSNGRFFHSRYYDVPAGWDMTGWDNLTSTPTWRRNSTGRFLIPDQRCGGVYWFKGVLDGAGQDRVGG